MDYLTLIPPALAHGSTTAGDTPGGSYGPLILLGVAVLLVCVFAAEKKWEKYKTSRKNGGK